MNKTERIQVRFTPKEKARIIYAAAKEDLKPSQYIRKKTLESTK